MKNIDTIQVWHGDLDGKDVDYQRYWRTLDEFEQAHAERITNDLLHKRYVETHGRLRRILAQTLNESPEKIRIGKGEHGKPYLADNPELAFNLSHSGRNMVVAVAWHCRLGIDIEQCRPRTTMAGLVDKCFAEEEIAYWQTLPEDRKMPEFYCFWTRKEAFVKATGRGIGLGLNRCVINPENPSEFLRVPAGCGQPSTWHIQDIAFQEHVRAAVVSDKKIIALKFFDWPA
jgi:4'-phosphopantetheinyl transferase